MKSLQQLSSVQETFHHSLMCTQGGRTPDVPITLNRPGTHSWVPGPGEPSREDSTDTSHHFTYGSCPSTRPGSQPHSESEGMEEESPVPSQHCCIPSCWLGLDLEHPGDSEVCAFADACLLMSHGPAKWQHKGKMSREGHEKLLSHSTLRFLFAPWL